MLSDNKKEAAFLSAIREAPSKERVEVESASWPKLKPHACYGVFNDIVNICTANSEADRASILLTSLVHAGAILGTQSYLRIGDTIHHPRLFSVLVGQSSKARKGTSRDSVVRVFDAVQENIARRSNKPYPLGLKLDARPGPLSSGEGIIYHIRDASEMLDKEGNPVDAGVEDKRLMIADGEFGGVLRVAERQGSTLSAIMRTAWDSGNIAPLTKTNPRKVTNGHMCFVSHIVSDELQALMKSVDAWNGFANRILWACVKRPRLVALPQPMPEVEVNQIAEKLADRLIRAVEFGELRLSEAARNYWEKCYPDLSRDDNGLLGAVTSRAEAQVLRISMIFVLMDGADITDIHIEAAIAVWGYCRDSARYLFGRYQSDPKAQKLIGTLATESPMTKTDIHELFSNNLKHNDLEALLADLQSEGYIEIRKLSLDGNRKPTTLVFLAGEN